VGLALETKQLMRLLADLRLDPAIC